MKRSIWRQFPLTLQQAVLIVLAGALTAAPLHGAGWHTSGTKILAPDNSEFQISGVNWYGFETRDQVAHGMWTADYHLIVDQVRQFGFNTIRIPFSNEMWESNPVPRAGAVSACPDCKGKRSRDILALIISYAGSQGLHVILDNHRSDKGNSAQSSGLWYTNAFPEQAWISDWVNIQRWVHGIAQPGDTVTLNYLASDGNPIVLGYDLRNEPHTPSRTPYLEGSTWGSGDGIDPLVNPNPNPFSPACVASSTCHDWRLAAERCGTTLLGEANANGWDYPLIVVEGIGLYPSNGGSAASGPYDGTWWGGNLLGVNGNSTNPGAPIVLNAGGDASALGPPVANQLVYSAHDYGPDLFRQSWFNSETCYDTGCSSSSLSDVWHHFWAHLNTGEINPTWPGNPSYPWSNTGHTPYLEAPVWIGEFGTGKSDDDLYSSGAGSQGQWFTAMVNFIQSSVNRTTANYSGIPVTDLHWTYWALNGNDNDGLLGSNWDVLANDDKVFTFLCAIQSGPNALPPGTGAGQCGSTGDLPPPDGGGGEPGGVLHVSNILMSSSNNGPNYRALAQVTIADESGAPVSGAAVFGIYSGATSGSVSGTTDTSGRVTLASSTKKNGGTWTFCVDTVTKSGWTYNPAANAETCDSITAP